jgi:hypothetical protein
LDVGCSISDIEHRTSNIEHLITMPTPTTDFSIFDGQELVSYEPVSDSPVSNIPAIRRPLTQSRQRNVERFVELFATDVVFHLDATPLASTDLAAGDSLTDADSLTYVVIFIERQTLDNTVAVVCRPPGL